MERVWIDSFEFHLKFALRNLKSAILLGALLLALCLPAEAQQPKKIPRVAYLAVLPLSATPERIAAFRQGLRDLRYVEGENIVIEWRFAEGNVDRLPALAAELVQLKVDVIVSAGQAVTRPVKAATSTIPIVMTQDTDPVANGFVASVARPGGNITGLSTLGPELSGKRLELLKEIVPRLTRVAFFGSSTAAGYAQVLKETELGAGALRVKLQSVDVLAAKDIEPAFRAAVKGRADAALINVSGSVAMAQRKEIATLAIKNRLPTMYTRAEYVEAGGLMNYGVSFNDMDRRAAYYVVRILKGAKPADLPVEQPTKFEFIINLKAAKQIGLTIPPDLLARATKIIR